MATSSSWRFRPGSERPGAGVRSGAGPTSIVWSANGRRNRSSNSGSAYPRPSYRFRILFTKSRGLALNGIERPTTTGFRKPISSRPTVRVRITSTSTRLPSSSVPTIAGRTLLVTRDRIPSSSPGAMPQFRLCLPSDSPVISAFTTMSASPRSSAVAVAPDRPRPPRPDLTTRDTRSPYHHRTCLYRNQTTNLLVHK